ncbi:hypothetical protein ACFY6U_44690 [Streptomyces sp. NPDC013157]|uniref:hypothetical protein n=1 Tax=Streptomyces sp. NPDC013157 TaxID=3364861 RepID=UPI0036942DC2
MYAEDVGDHDGREAGDIVDINTDPALIGRDKRNDTTPVETRVLRPQGNIEIH